MVYNWMIRLSALSILVSLTVLPGTTNALCRTTAESDGKLITASAECDESSGSYEPSRTPQEPSVYSKYRWTAYCHERTGQPNEVAGYICQDSGMDLCEPGSQPRLLEGLRDGKWESIGVRCVSTTELQAAEQITSARVRTAFEQLQMPTPALRVQPAGTTLVQLPTVFYTDTKAFTHTLTLLGQQVELAVRPARFDWDFGDGTTHQSTEAGAPWPDLTISHQYRAIHPRVHPQVQVTWEADWRLNNGPWQQVPGTATSTSAPVSLKITEAIPALTR